MTDMPNCELCGLPMPPGETMFKFHGYSGPCPRPMLPKSAGTCARCGATREQDPHEFGFRDHAWRNKCERCGGEVCEDGQHACASPEIADAPAPSFDPSDVRLVANAGPWVARSWWSTQVPVVMPKRDVTRNLVDSDRIGQAAVRILNRLARASKRRGEGKS